MSRPQDVLIRRLCVKAETLTRAQILLHTASVRTGPGTGYDLGLGTLGLPAICAYLASQELANGDVSEKVAQTASCLAPKVFKATLKTVRTALAAIALQDENSSDPLTYEALIADQKLGRKGFVSGCMNDVEKSLIASQMLPAEFQTQCDILRVTIFCWTCHTLLRIKRVKVDAVLEDYAISRQDYDDIVEILQSSCQDVAEKVKQKVAELSNVVTATLKTPHSSPSKQAPSDTPSKQPPKPSLKSLQQGARNTETSPTKTPTHKRKVAFAAASEEDETDLLETPSKRPRIVSPKKTVQKAQIVTTQSAQFDPVRAVSARPAIFRNSVASSSRTTLDKVQHTGDGSRDEVARLEDQAATVELPSASPAAASAQAAPVSPSTPRRRLPQPTRLETPTQTPQRSGDRSRTRMSRGTSSLADDTARRRRFRPVFLDQSQWFQRDPRIEREWKAAETRRSQLIQQKLTTDRAREGTVMIAA